MVAEPEDAEEALAGFSCFGELSFAAGNGGSCPGEAMCCLAPVNSPPGGGSCVYMSIFPTPGMLTVMGGGVWCLLSTGVGRPWPDGWDECCGTVTCTWRVITLGAAVEAVTPPERGAPAEPCGKSTGVQTCPCQTEGQKWSPS